MHPRNVNPISKLNFEGIAGYEEGRRDLEGEVGVEVSPRERRKGNRGLC